MDGHSGPYYDFSTVEGMQKWQQDMLNMVHTNQTQFGNPMMVFNKAQMGLIQGNASSSNNSYPTSVGNPMMAFNQEQMGLSQANAGSSNSSYPTSIGNSMMPFIQPQMTFNRGGYTDLIYEQIISSQEENDATQRISAQTVQVQQGILGPLTQRLLSNNTNALDETFITHNDYTDSTLAYQDYGEDHDRHLPSMNEDEISDELYIDWQQNLFNNISNEVEQTTTSEHGLSTNNGEASTTREVASGVTEETENGDGHANEIGNGDANELLTEEEIDEFIMIEQVVASQGNNASVDSMYTPQLHQKFDSKDDVQYFFSLYAFLAGFKVAIRHSLRTTSKKRNQEYIKVEMKCTRAGKPKGPKSIEQEEADVEKQIGKKPVDKRNTSVQKKIDCPCIMLAKEEYQGGKWVVVNLDLDHNHELRPGDRDMLFSGRKYMTDMEKGLIRTLNANNISTRQMVNILSYLRGGDAELPMKKKDIGNYRTKINSELKKSDMAKVMDYFRRRQKDDGTSFYKFQFDDEKRITNLFWADACSIKYYQEFGDCVSFDTTFMTNRYNLPFAPFVGITGHAQSCMFGCAFLHDQTTETFQWVFEAFLEAMGGKHPQTIITDQDMAMRAAIELVFPYTRHRNCLFHIKTKCYNKNSKLFAAKVNMGLLEDFEDIINKSLTIEDFERDWVQLIRDKNLERNNYISRMWDMRHRFIPVYYKNDSFPFIQTTSRSESLNSRIKENIGPTCTITKFITEYDRLIETINRNEQQEDCYSNEKTPKEYIFGYTIEMQAAELYNRAIFKKFQIQLKATARLSYQEMEQGTRFEVWPKSNQIHKVHRVRRYTVTTYLTEGNEEFTCICAKFSKDGVLCSHILKIIIEKEISRIPDKYIIPRWRKKSSNRIVRNDQQESLATSSLLRYNVLSRKSAVINDKGSKSQNTMEYVLGHFDKLVKDLDIVLANEQIAQGENQDQAAEDGQSSAPPANQERNTMPAAQTEQDTDTEIEAPEVVKKQGRPAKAKRFQTFVEDLRRKEEEKEKRRIAAAEKKKATEERKKATQERKKAVAERNKNKKPNDTDSTGGSPVKPQRKKRKETTKATRQTQGTAGIFT